MKYTIYCILLIILTVFTSYQILEQQADIPMFPLYTVLLMAICILIGIGFKFLNFTSKLGFLKDSDYNVCIELKNQTLRSIIVVLGVIIILILIASSWFIYYYYSILNQNWSSGGDSKIIFALFNIAGENTISTWCASMIFMLTGLINLLLFFYIRKLTLSKAQRKTVWGWFLISIFFIGLSADEMGSIHERLGMLFNSNNVMLQYGSLFKVGLILAGIVGLYMIWFFVQHFKSYLLALLFFGAGILGITSVVLFEEGWDNKMDLLIETATELQQIIQISILEEGLELLSSWFFLIGCLLVLFKIGEDKQVIERSANKVISIRVQPGVLIGSTFFLIAVVAFGVGIIAPILEFGIEGGDTGITRNWFPSALAFSAAILAWIKWNTYNEDKRYRYLILLGILLALSIYHGAYFRYWLSILESLPVSVLLLYHITILIGIGIFIIANGFKSLMSWQGVLFIFWALSLSVTFFGLNGPANPIDIFPFIFLFPFLISLILYPQDCILVLKYLEQN